MDTFWIKYALAIAIFLLLGSVFGHKGDPVQQQQLYNAGVTEMYEKGELSNSYE